METRVWLEDRAWPRFPINKLRPDLNAFRTSDPAREWFSGPRGSFSFITNDPAREWFSGPRGSLFEAASSRQPPRSRLCEVISPKQPPRSSFEAGQAYTKFIQNSRKGYTTFLPKFMRSLREAYTKLAHSLHTQSFIQRSYQAYTKLKQRLYKAETKLIHSLYIQFMYTRHSFARPFKRDEF